MTSRFFAGLVVLGFAAGCASEVERHTYPVRVLALDADNEPVEGMRLTADGRDVGAADASGTLLVQLTGVEGERVALRPACPQGYSGPPADTIFWLRRLIGIDGQPAQAQVSMTCEALEHRLVVVLRTNEPGIPLRILNDRAAQTSKYGIAHVTRTGRVGASFTISLDTSSDPDLRPVSPARLFRIEEKDTYVIWEQPFQRYEPPPPPKAKRKRAPPPPKKHVPYRLGAKG